MPAWTRATIGLLLLVLLIQLGLRAQNQDPFGAAERTVLHPGDPISRVRMRALPRHDEGRRGTASHPLAEDCVIAIFCHSTCGACDGLAPFWSGIRHVKLGGSYAKVIWVTSDDDTAAASAWRSYDLAAAYSVPSTVHFKRMGVHQTPTLYLVTRDTLVAELPRLPADIPRGGYHCGLKSGDNAYDIR